MEEARTAQEHSARWKTHPSQLLMSFPNFTACKITCLLWFLRSCTGNATVLQAERRVYFSCAARGFLYLLHMCLHQLCGHLLTHTRELLYKRNGKRKKKCSLWAIKVPEPSYFAMQTLWTCKTSNFYWFCATNQFINGYNKLKLYKIRAVDSTG